MALGIFSRNKYGNTSWVQWHVHCPKPSVYIEDVVEVVADGDELNKVYFEIQGIPVAPKFPVVTWFGDDARFIVANLNY